jgi:hypothetical protein
MATPVSLLDSSKKNSFGPFIKWDLGTIWQQFGARDRGEWTLRQHLNYLLRRDKPRQSVRGCLHEAEQ